MRVVKRGYLGVMRGFARGIAVFAALGALLAPAAAIAGETTPQPAREILSTPGNVSRWSFVVRKAIVRKTPEPGAKAVARLRLKTQDGTDEIVMVLERVTDAQQRRW